MERWRRRGACRCGMRTAELNSSVSTRMQTGPRTTAAPRTCSAGRSTFSSTRFLAEARDPLHGSIPAAARLALLLLSPGVSGVSVAERGCASPSLATCRSSTSPPGSGHGKATSTCYFPPSPSASRAGHAATPAALATALRTTRRRQPTRSSSSPKRSTASPYRWHLLPGTLVLACSAWNASSRMVKTQPAPPSAPAAPARPLGARAARSPLLPPHKPPGPPRWLRTLAAPPSACFRLRDGRELASPPSVLAACSPCRSPCCPRTLAASSRSGFAGKKPNSG